MGSRIGTRVVAGSKREDRDMAQIPGYHEFSGEFEDPPTGHLVTSPSPEPSNSVEP